MLSFLGFPNVFGISSILNSSDMLEGFETILSSFIEADLIYPDSYSTDILLGSRISRGGVSVKLSSSISTDSL